MLVRTILATALLLVTSCQPTAQQQADALAAAEAAVAATDAAVTQAADAAATEPAADAVAAADAATDAGAAVGSDGALQLPTLTQAEIAEILASTRSRSFSSDCTYDCSGHDAGYDWAEENDIDDPDDCGGNSNSFIEGCEQYAEEQQSDAEDERLAEEERAEEARREEEERSAEEEQEDSDY